MEEVTEDQVVTQEAEVVGVDDSGCNSERDVTHEAEEGAEDPVGTKETEVDGEDGSDTHYEQVVIQEEEVFVEDNVSVIPPPISIPMLTNECD